MKIVFSVIFLTTLAGVILAVDKPLEWKVLFDGTNLSNFRGYHQKNPSGSWTIESGILKFKKKKGAKGGDLMTRDKFQFFDLELDWKLPAPGNSGIIFRVAETDGPAYKTGPEMQIFHRMKAGEKTDTGSCYGLYAPKVANMNPVTEWNKAKLVIKPGNRVSHFLNGRLLCNYQIGGNDWNKRVKNSKFEKWEQFGKINRGHICLQDHGNEIWFRNIRIRKF